MKLSDIMSAAGLSTYAEIALVIFLLAFIAIVVSLFAPGRQRTYERMRHLPIAPDSPDMSFRAQRGIQWLRLVSWNGNHWMHTLHAARAPDRTLRSA